MRSTLDLLHVLEWRGALDEGFSDGFVVYGTAESLNSSLLGLLGVEELERWWIVLARKAGDF
jgi:hypothetical protein